jgi:hypothetical protein
MTHVKVTNQSWFSRIGGAIKGIFIGFVLIVAAFPFLFWNEGRAVHRHKTLMEGAGLAQSVSADHIVEVNDGNLVHVTGTARTDAILHDAVFGVSVNAIHLWRNVEMYQWKEIVESKTQTKTGGGTETTETYTYQKTWSNSLINSNNFKERAGRENPHAMPYEYRAWAADTVTLGAFTLPRSMISRISNATRLDILPGSAVPEALGNRARVHDSGYYIGADPPRPQIGDVRVSFSAVYPGELSIVAKQTGNTFESFITPKTGGTISLLQTGAHAREAMFQSAVSANQMLTWVLRVVGFVLFMVGFSLILQPLKVVADVIPIMGRIVGAGTGMIAFLLSAVLWLLVVSLAWVFYRPLIGLPLLILAIGLTIFTVKKIQAAKMRKTAVKSGEAAE